MKRYIVIFGRDNERGITEETVHGEKERLLAMFRADKRGYDFIQVFEY